MDSQSDQQLVLSACRSVAKLHRRLFAAALDYRLIGELGDQRREPWRVSELQPRSEWLEGVRPELAVVFVASASAAVLEALLAELEASRIDRLRICLLLQALAVEASSWTPPVRRLADRWSLELPASPRDSHAPLQAPVSFRRSR
jgi:hypothetical protein